MTRIAYKKWRIGDDAAVNVSRAIDICEDYATRGFNLSLRQLYYQMVARDYIANNQRSYKNLGNQISRARLAGLLDWSFIEDRTRNLLQRSRWADPSHAIESIAEQFHIDLWRDQELRIEVWVEKDALADVVSRPSRRYDIPYFACKGYVSQSEMWAAAQRIGGHINNGQRVLILHLGDHDPSGIDMTRDITDRITEFLHTDLANKHRLWGDSGTCTQSDIGRWFAGDHGTHAHDAGLRGIPFTVDRIALNMDQIEEQGPPPNPTKLSDSRSREYVDEFGHESWELDALSPEFIDDLIVEHIERHFDPDIHDEALGRKAEMKGILTDLADIDYADLREFVDNGGSVD